jgi:hypothetical protein
MTSKFAAGFFTGLKEGPSLFFAPLIGAIKGIRDELRRVLTHRSTCQSDSTSGRNHTR